MRTTSRSRRWLPGGGSHHPFLYRRREVIDLTAVEKLVDSMRDVVDLVAAEESSTPPAPRRRGIADPFTLARR